MTFKEQVYKTCLDILTGKIKLVQQTLWDLKESASNETKSTAGDKHETALAMLQIEQKNLGVQLENLLAQKAILDKINPTITPVLITTGSLVKTNKGYFFVSVPVGKMTVAGINLVALSPQSPLAINLLQLKAGDIAVFNGTKYEIMTIE